MMNIYVPQNSRIREEIAEIVRLCEAAVPEYGDKSSYFESAVEESEITEWETRNGVKIPESYKEWLRFSANCQIRQTLAAFYSPRYFSSEHVPSELVVIGHLIGDGEVLCFSKNNGKFVRYFEGRVNDEFEDFIVMLKEVIRMLKGESGISNEAKELFMKFLKASQEREKNKEKEK